jgi:hypothetical protein
MTISFRCNNPNCQKSVNAPDGTEGRKARCPQCGTIQVIPTSAPEPEFEPLRFLEKDSPPAVADDVSCGDCGAKLPPNAMLCSQCGWVNPSSTGAPPTPQPTTAATIPTAGSMVGECIKAPAYGFSNIGSLTKLVLYSIGLGIIVNVIRGFFDWLMFMGPIGVLIRLLVELVGGIVISGYFFRFYLDCGISSLEGVNQAPDVPEFDLKALFNTGLRWLGVLCVYILPVITIPLLPLGLLAWAYSDDLRMFDVRWALRAAAKKPGQLLTLWLMMLIWGAVGIVATIIFWLLLMALGGACLLSGGGGFSGLLMALLLIVIGGFFISVVFHTFMAVQFRCVGMLGRYNPDLLDMLSETPSGNFSIGVLVAGVVISITVGATTVGGMIAEMVKIQTPPSADEINYPAWEEDSEDGWEEDSEEDSGEDSDEWDKYR